MAWFSNKGQMLELGAAIIFGTFGLFIAVLGSAAVLAATVGIAQKVMGLSVDWWILLLVFVGGLLLMWWSQRLVNKRPPISKIEVSPLQPDIYAQTEPLKPLKNASYLSSMGHGAIFSSHYDDGGETVELAALWVISITNDLFSNDVGAAEATGIRGEIIYYDAKWQRLFGPVQACWVFERGAKGDMETYLNADPITLGPQETYKLAIVIRMSKNGPLFALGKESLSFFSWRNPAFKLDNQLDNHCRLQVVLKGDAIQRTLYFQLRCVEEGRVDVSHILLPEK